MHERLLPSWHSSYLEAAAQGGAIESILTSVLALGAIALYFEGRRRLAGEEASAAPDLAESCSFVLGVLVASVALLAPPLDDHVDNFAVHMAQHLVLVAISAPLLALGRVEVLGAAVPRPPPQAAPFLSAVASRLRAVPTPLLALGTFVAVFWAWHVPSLYLAALGDGTIHALEHGTMLLAAVWFWSTIRMLAAGDRFRQPLAIVLVLGAMFTDLILAAILSFSDNVLYPLPGYTETQLASEQHLGGIVTLMAGNLVYGIAVLVLIFRILNREDRLVSPRFEGPEL